MPPVDVPADEVDQLGDPASDPPLDLREHERRDQAADAAAVDAEDLHDRESSFPQGGRLATDAPAQAHTALSSASRQSPPWPFLP